MSGPWAVFGYANDVLGRTAYVSELVSPGGGAVRSRHGLVLGSSRKLPVSPSRFPDVAIVAGGSPFERMPAAETTLARWLRRFHGRISQVVSICTGAFVLGEAGLLDGRQCTTHWRYLEELRHRYPAARVVEESIFVRDGAVWTSAGITTGLDVSLAVVETEHGHRVAMEVAKQLVMFLRRSGHQTQFSPMLRRQEHESTKLRDVSSFVLEHIDEQLPVQRIAAAVGMSPRSLSRWCREQFGQSPAELVRSHRIDEARRLLESTALPLKDIASRSGLGNTSTMWRAFTERLGVTPADYRERFAAAHPSA